MNVKMKSRDILIILFISNVIQNIISFNENSNRQTKASNTFKSNLVMLTKDNPDGTDKFKIITPDNIASLFNNNIQNINSETKKLNITFESSNGNNADSLNDGNEEDDVNDLEEEEYIYMDPDVNGESIAISENINTMKELQELEYLTKIPMKSTLTTLINSYDDDNSNNDDDNVNNNTKQPISSLEEDFEDIYSNLSGPLNKNKLQQVKAAMTMFDSTDSITQSSYNNPSSLLNDSMVARRIFKFDPTEVDRADRMQYGAYRRWKTPELEPGSNTVTKPKSDKMRDPGSKTKSSPTKKKKNGKLTSDNFYNAIKNLGSGPVEKGSTQGTGVAEPPPGKKNIQPKKAPARNANSKKKVITPSDIDSLFSKQNKADDDDDDDDDDVYNVNNDDDDDDDYKNIEKLESSSRTTTTTTSSSSVTFNPMIGPNEEMPQWLIDADKEAKKKNKAMKNRKKKKLTDDWRFWAAIIGGVGFISAFINIYQKTGGLGSGDYNNADASSGNEMLI